MTEESGKLDQQSTDQIGKWVRIGLVISLGLNIFLGGFVAARMLGPKSPENDPEIVGLNLRGLPLGLSSEVREELENSMREHRHEIREAYRDYREQQREINQLLREDELNERGLERAYEQLRELNAEIQGPMQRALVDAMRQMDRDTRNRVIEMRKIPRVRRFGEPKSVDGSRWRFDWKGEDSFQLDMDEMDFLPDFEFDDTEEPAEPEDQDDQ